ncbi:uncharacterized protein B0I36DRAFT_353986 [Microdochium trichocladiopsis]|uniref:Centrosomin N-terminal motif 1 domain-containing protein n=1 Tax=Microdochium trichocladiopsis TaxID=1682393 RepID=A0A9P9BKJ7_9PEZI|nr:uncharacterized protein B0I36DRAFT_353986 [Microdochium trichocladiopsis]KAH7021314.1 hypothetical protein B0I36DRAFT_353986 [Microdochium trichocladiopsis]
MSSLLQERLQRERQLEGSTWSRRPSDSGMSTSVGDLRDRNIRDSPVQRSSTAMGEKAAGEGVAEQGEHKGFGVKEMEQALSTLHKQNFDLKLELYHRRERQTALEGRVEELETEKAEATTTVNNLQFELDARDKAISEAVAMIVQLEARVEELTLEREMVRQVDVGGPYLHPSPNHVNDADRSMTPKPQLKHLPRMPSFLSEHSEQTENLRNVVLANRRSFVHARNISDASAAPSELNRITSPSLSVLSESSFASIYGDSSGYEYVSALPPTVKVIADSPQVAASPRRRQESIADLRSAAAGTASTSPDRSATKNGVPMHSLNQVMDVSSPLPKTRQARRPEVTPYEMGSPRPSSRGQGVMTPSPSRANDLQRYQRAVRAGRETLQHVNTSSGLPQKDHGGYHNLPPTPDTVASSVLRKHPGVATSGDSLSGQFVSNAHIHTPEWANKPTDGSRSPMRKSSADMNGQLASLTAFTSGNAMPQINTDVLIASFSATSQPQARPQSAAATSSTRARGNSWASDSDSDGGADAHSEDDLDYWMQESLKPNNPGARRGGRPVEQQRSSSPDLFSFPANSSGWQPDQIFGAQRGIGVMSSPVAALKRDPLDEMSAALNTERRVSEIQLPGPNQPPPPTPHRISSLHARTGSTDGTVFLGRKTDKLPFRSPRRFSIGGDKNRSHSMDTATQTSPPKMQPLRQHSEPGEPAKKSQYPPIAGQTTRGRLNAFFRRAGSLSMAPGALAGAATQPPASPAADRDAPRDGRCSVPPPSPRPWPVNRNLSDTMSEDLQSATPPPILRNRVPRPEFEHSPGGGVNVEAGPQPDNDDGRAKLGLEGTDVESQGDNGAPLQGKRRWLGLGRKTSVKKG